MYITRVINYIILRYTRLSYYIINFTRIFKITFVAMCAGCSLHAPFPSINPLCTDRSNSSNKQHVQNKFSPEFLLRF